MTSHNTGKINWNIIHQNIQWTSKNNKNKFLLVDDNIKPLKFLSSQILGIIKDFSSNLEKKQSINPLMIKYNGLSLNPVDWVLVKFPNITDEEISNTILYQYLLRGNTMAVEAYLPIILKSYIFFNLILSDYKYYYMVPFDYSQYTSNCDHDLPKFIVDEIRNVWGIINPIICHERLKNNQKCYCRFCHGYGYDKNIIDIDTRPIKPLTSNEISEIKNTCGLLFKCLYLGYRDYGFDDEFIFGCIESMFGFDYNFN